MNKNILFVHGWGARSEKLIPLESQLKNLGWKTLVVKLPGFELHHPSGPLTLSDYVGFVGRETARVFGRQKYFIFGHSFGGRIAIKSALVKKDRLSGVILCATGGISRASFLKRILFGLLAKIGKIFVFIAPVANLWKRLIYKAAGEHDYQKTSGNLRETFKNIINENLKNKVKDIDIPALIIWGRKDKMTPYKDALYLKKSMNDSKLITYKYQGHQLPYKKYKQIAQEINRWAENNLQKS